MLVQVETDSEVQDNLKLALDNAKRNQNAARLKFSFEKKNIYICIFFQFFFYLVDVKCFSQSSCPISPKPTLQVCFS